MALTKLGKYIEVSDLRNSDDKYGPDAVVGISTQKKMITTKADLDGVKLTSYKLLPPGYFAYVPDTSRRGDKMSLCFNNTEDTLLVSSISVVFYITDEKELNPDYLFMYFNRPEFDRYSRFNSWGSARDESTFYKCNIFYPRDFVYNPSVISKGAIAFNSHFEEPKICTEEYIVFYVEDEDKLSPEYLFLWLKRDETGRFMDFMNIDSVRNRVYFRDLENIEIPIPNIDIQRSIAEIFIAYNERKVINERLKAQIKDMCPILIKGSIEEARA